VDAAGTSVRLELGTESWACFQPQTPYLHKVQLLFWQAEWHKCLLHLATPETGCLQTMCRCRPEHTLTHTAAVAA